MTTGLSSSHRSQSHGKKCTDSRSRSSVLAIACCPTSLSSSHRRVGARAPAPASLASPLAPEWLPHRAPHGPHAGGPRDEQRRCNRRNGGRFEESESGGTLSAPLRSPRRTGLPSCWRRLRARTSPTSPASSGFLSNFPFASPQLLIHDFWAKFRPSCFRFLTRIWHCPLLPCSHSLRRAPRAGRVAIRVLAVPRHTPPPRTGAQLADVSVHRRRRLPRAQLRRLFHHPFFRVGR